MARWLMVVTDLGFSPIGEVINASNRTVDLPLDKTTTAGFKVRLDNPLADQLMSCECYLKAYRYTAASTTPQLRFFGPVVSAEESADGDDTSIQVNAAGSEWGISHLLAQTQDVPYTLGPGDRALITSLLIQGALDHSVALGGTRTIDTSTGPHTSGATSTYVVQFKNVADSLTELSATSAGFDWRVVPIDNYSAGAVTSNTIGRFEAYPTIGVVQGNAVFEWGCGRSNIASYKRVTDRSTQANIVWHNASAGPGAPGFPTVSAQNNASIAKWGAMMDLAVADIDDLTLRQNLVDEHVAVRAEPRKTIELTPHIDPYDSGRLPIFGVDYDVGDTVVARAKFGNSVRFNLQTRVWGASFAINEDGLEQQTLKLSDG